ncbi:hypothetical protein J437_LFUL011010 [Ladona fulva]|uniref:Cuticle protein CPCFC domain-containing protein n=1 Tax=Ladona fulva TaxID=123851 RepID=A0A8K0P7R0_LADFU|nr:hypothetical protein J437_LFUL011010 [Ladona fulva]
MMNARLIILAVCVVGTFGNPIPLAAKYPAGVNPHACPNYPYCDNALTAHAPYAAPAYAAYGHHGGVPGAAAKYPAGVDPHLCPNYPFCGPAVAHVPGVHGGWEGAGAWAGAHHGWDDGSYHGDDEGTYYGGDDDGSYNHWDDGSYNEWDDGSYNHWDDGSYHGDGHHW